MRLSDFDYELPRELIAQEPLRERDASRLLVVDRKLGVLHHRRFRELPSLLVAGDLLVVNDTRVIPARVYGTRRGFAGEVEVLLLHPVRSSSEGGGPAFKALVRPARKLPAGTVLRLGTSKVEVVVQEVVDEKSRVLEFPQGFAVMPFLEREGRMPLPPYIDREDVPMDRERYQTLFADRAGAVAAPTAGLHFTTRVLEDLAHAGFQTARITLHVGAGTFTPVVAPDPRAHVMEPEHYRISPEAAAQIGETRRRGGRVVAVGTTVVRALETAQYRDAENGVWSVMPGEAWTEKYIYPPYTFRVVDALLTNFHLPRSTLLILVSAFAGLELVRRAYHEAIREEYRFYSYGDAMLLL